MAGPRIIPQGSRFWDDKGPKLLTSVRAIQEAYEDGWVGAYKEPEELASLLAENIALTGYGSIEDASSANGWAGSGKGLLSIPFVHVLEAYPGCWPGPAQTRGDCFPAGTLVRMADGSEKPIEDIKEGESVASPFGGERRVSSTLRKQYAGKLVKIVASGYSAGVESTPDHKFVSYENALEWRWKQSGEVSIDDTVLLPKVALRESRHKFDLAEFPGCTTEGENEGTCVRRVTPKDGYVRSLFGNRSTESKRYVELDASLAWLLGLFLAEGGIDQSSSGKPKRITLSLNANELELALKAKKVFWDKFGVKASTSILPSKPTVMLVRVSSIPIATFFMSLVGDVNQWSKSVPKELYTSAPEVRLAALRGWMDGDGCLAIRQRSSKCVSVKLTGVSVSLALAAGMHQLARSVDIRSTLTRRKPRGRSKAAYDVHMYGSDAITVFPEASHQLVTLRKKPRRDMLVEHGVAPKIKEVSRRYFSGTVYCIGVEEDHAFIANGYAVHNCVSHSAKNSALGTMACEVVAGDPDEETGLTEGMPEVPAEGVRQGVLSTEAIYWWRGHGGDGWYCGAAARVMQSKSGLWLRKNYPELGFDLTKYSGSLAGRWGRTAPTGKVAEAGKLHLARAFAEARTNEARRDAIANGYFGFTCGGESFSNKRDSYGVSPRTRAGWAHALTVIAYDDRPEIVRRYGGPLELILNSWAVWNSGPRDIYDSAKYVPPNKKQAWIDAGIVNPSTGNIMIPHGSMWVRARDVSQREWLAVSSVNGWPKKKMDNWGWKI